MINCQFSLCSCERFSESENLNELSLSLRIIWQFSLTSHDTQLKINYFRLVCHLYGQLLVAALNAVRWNCTKMLNYEFDAWALGTGGREQNDFSVLAPKWCHKPIEWNRIPAPLALVRSWTRRSLQSRCMWKMRMQSYAQFSEFMRFPNSECDMHCDTSINSECHSTQSIALLCLIRTNTRLKSLPSEAPANTTKK